MQMSLSKMSPHEDDLPSSLSKSSKRRWSGMEAAVLWDPRPEMVPQASLGLHIHKLGYLQRFGFPIRLSVISSSYQLLVQLGKTNHWPMGLTMEARHIGNTLATSMSWSSDSDDSLWCINGTRKLNTWNLLLHGSVNQCVALCFWTLLLVKLENSIDWLNPIKTRWFNQLKLKPN